MNLSAIRRNDHSFLESRILLEKGQSKIDASNANDPSTNAIFSLLALRLAARFRLVRTRNIPYSAGKSYSLLGTSFRAHWIS